MLIRYGFRLSISVTRPTDVIARLDIHPDRRSEIVSEVEMTVGGCSAPTPIIDVHGNLCRRLVVESGETMFEQFGIMRDPGSHEPQISGEPATPVSDLPPECLVYLLGSRYCETDCLGERAWQLFGHIPAGAARVRAIVDFVHTHVKFGYPHARPTRTALETFNERLGVCRDFAHLTITLCRCLNIPARYVNGYLGDIGVPRDPAAMDFSAWVEVFLDGRWFTLDARHNTPRIGRIVIARGRDATDVPMLHSFGPHVLQEFKVIAEETDGTGANHQAA
jgi:transglutaminase-like putative cysteine protease